MRKLALLTTLAIAALAMTATPAFAATEVRDAETEELCPEVSPAINTANPLQAMLFPQTYASGGCTVHMEAVSVTAVGLADLCRVDYDLHIGPDGWGYANNFEFSSGGGVCGAWTMLAGSRTVAPPDVNPSGLFTRADADTDFNTYWHARRLYMGTNVNSTAWVSLDATASNPLEIANQIPYNGGNFGGGDWVAETGLIITH